MPKIVHFEIYADDPERAVGFYSQVFDWQIDRQEAAANYWTVKTGSEDAPGLNGSIMGRANQGTFNVTIQVPSIDECLEQIAAAGGSVVTPKTPLAGLGFMAYCADTEGNIFGIIEIDRSLAAPPTTR
jgi:predicted enzyme related to lactoylglutathione lyase